MTVWIFPLFCQTYIIIKNTFTLHVLGLINITLPYRSVVSYSTYVKECLCKVQSCGAREITHVYIDEHSTKAYMTLFEQEPVLN